MDELKFGARDRRGYYTPNEPLRVAPILVWPWSVTAFVKWLPSYFLPWNALFVALATVIWFLGLPPLAAMKVLGVGWVALIWIENVVVVLIIFGALELRLYFKRCQARRFKFNRSWPSEHPSKVFWFTSQNVDNFLRTFFSGIPIWTAYEVLILWAAANGWGLWTTFWQDPIWLGIFALLLPIYHEVHFYCIHRSIHTPALYKYIHSVHHNSVNPSPWSSLSMHPVEHLLYFSDCLIHLIIPSHPLLLIYNLQITGTGAVVGHVGFDKVEIGRETGLNTHAFTHYLHHKYFEVNYADGTIPLDKWFGTWHDGSWKGVELMDARRAKRRSKMNIKSNER